MKLFRQYILASVLPSLSIIITDLFKMPKDCKQCILLSCVAGGLMFAGLLLLNLFYFLMFLNFRPIFFRIVLGAFACFSPAILLAVYLFKTYYKPQEIYNTDFNLAFPSVIVALIIGCWSFYIYLKSSPAYDKDLKIQFD